MIHLSLIFSMFFRFGILGAFWIYGFIIVLKFGKKNSAITFSDIFPIPPFLYFGDSH